MANKTIVLTELISGVKITPQLQEAHAGALNYVNTNTDLGLLINDIGVMDRLKAFIQEGPNGVLKKYKEWQKNNDCRGTAGLLCGHGNLMNLKIDDIDDLFYLFETRNYHKFLRDFYLRSNPSRLKEEQKFSNYRRDKEREYWLEALKEDNPQIFFETELRNETSRNVQKDRKNNWRELGLIEEKESGFYLGTEKVRNENKNITCQGILLTLYDKLANIGYEKIIQHFPIESEDAIFTATKNYQYLSHKSIKENWDYVFKKLEFETKFYGGK
jgi:hypothetical protein